MRQIIRLLVIIHGLIFFKERVFWINLKRRNEVIKFVYVLGLFVSRLSSIDFFKN